jgi:hypothetical protein
MQLSSARGMGKCAIVGCKEIEVDAKQKFFFFRLTGTAGL